VLILRADAVRANGSSRRRAPETGPCPALAGQSSRGSRWDLAGRIVGLLPKPLHVGTDGAVNGFPVTLASC
jgi:hypothetical protein